MPVAAPLAAGAATAVVGSLLNKGGGGGGTTTTNTIQNADPWEAIQPHLRSIYDVGYRTFQSNPYNIAGQSPQTLQAQDLQSQRALSGSPLTRAAQDENQKTLRGDYLSVDSNPYLQGAVQQAMGDTKRMVNSQFSGDNYGGSAHQEWMNRGLLNTALPAYAQNYSNERQRQMGATALAPTLANQDYTDIGQLGAAGAAKDIRSQAEADAPWTQLQKYMQSIMGSNPGGGTTTGSAQQPYFTNPLANALGMGIGGLSLYNGMNQAGLLGGGGGGMVPEMAPGQYSLVNPQYG